MNSLKENIAREPTDYSTEIYPNQYSFSLEPSPEAEVFSIIKILSLKYSAGWDGISTSVLKKVSLLIIMPLDHIIYLSLSQGIFPDN
jgi:hypothetical protein